MAQRATVAVRHERPYSALQAFIDEEGWGVDADSIVLVGHEELKVGSRVRVEVVLTGGQTIIRAEGKVLANVPAEGDRPGGPRVSLRRVTRDTQRVVNQIVEQRAAAEAQGDRQSDADLAALAAEAPPMASEAPPPKAEAPAPPAEPSLRAARPRQVPAPPRREELLESLRERWQRKRAG